MYDLERILFFHLARQHHFSFSHRSHSAPDDATGETPNNRHEDDATTSTTHGDVVIYTRDQPTQRRHSLPSANGRIPLPAAKEKTSLAPRDFGLGAFRHTRLSWERLWHNCCSLILPPQFSGSHNPIQSAPPLRGCGSLQCVCVCVCAWKQQRDMSAGVRLWLREKKCEKEKQKKHRQTDLPPIVTGSGSSFGQGSTPVPLQAACLTKVWSFEAGRQRVTKWKV